MKRFLVASTLALALGASAQEPAAPKYAKSTTLNFEDDAIDGALLRPDGEHVQARQRVKHSNLIRVRTEFKARSMQSLGELR